MASTGFRGFIVTAASSAMVLLGLGCAPALEVTKLSAGAQRPANVALYVDVRDGGNGVKGLNEKSINIYEDGKLLPANKARRALLPPKVGVKYTMLLVDMSGSLAAKDTSAVSSAIGRFVDKLADKQEVAVSVFDGGDEITTLLPFGAGSEGVPAFITAMHKYKPKDTNTNWNGAVFQGLHALEKQLSASTFSPKSAALVVLTDRGTDQAFRVAIEAMKKKVRTSPADVFVIGVGPNINRGELTEVGRSGVYLSNDSSSYPKGFDEISHKLTSGSEGRYVVSYCSPKRKGDHTAEVEVIGPSGKARVSYRFNADGFKSGCSPKRAPSLNDESAPPAKEAVVEEKTEQPAKAEASEQADSDSDKNEKSETAVDDAPPRRPSGPVTPANDDELPRGSK